MFKSRFAREMQHYSSLTEEWFRDPDPDFPEGGPESRYSEANTRIKQTCDLQQIRSHSWIDGDLQEVNPHDLGEVKPQGWLDGAAFQKILDTSEHSYQTKNNKLKRNFSQGSLSDDQYKSRDNSPPARGNHPPVRRSMTSSCEPEDENLDELIPGGTVLQLSRIFESDGRPGGSNRTSFPPHPRSISSSSFRSSRSSTSSNLHTKSPIDASSNNHPSPNGQTVTSIRTPVIVARSVSLACLTPRRQPQPRARNIPVAKSDDQPIISEVSVNVVNPNFQQDTLDDTLQNRVNIDVSNDEMIESFEGAEKTTTNGSRIIVAAADTASAVNIAAADTASAVNIAGESVEESRLSEGPSSLSSEFDISSKESQSDSLTCGSINRNKFQIHQSNTNKRDEIQQMIKPEFRLDRYPPRISLETSRNSMQPSRDFIETSCNSIQTSRDSFQPSRDSLQSSRSSLEPSIAKAFLNKELHLNDLESLDPNEYDAGSTLESLTPDATSTPSQISKVETVLSFGARIRSEVQSIQILEAEINNLRLENKDLNHKLEFAKESARKYKSLEKEVDHLTWQLSKMEDSRKVYERATNQLVSFLDQVSQQLATNNRNPNTDRLSGESPASVSELLFGAGGGSRAELQQRMFGSILGEAMMAGNRAQSRQSWGGFNPGYTGPGFRQENGIINDYGSLSKCNRESRSSLGVPGNTKSNYPKLNEKRHGNQSCWNLAGPRPSQQHSQFILRGAKSERNINHLKDDNNPDFSMEKNGMNKNKLFPSSKGMNNFSQDGIEWDESSSMMSARSQDTTDNRSSSNNHRQTLQDGSSRKINAKECHHLLKAPGTGGRRGCRRRVGEEVEGVSLESKDSGRSTDSGSGRSTPKTPQNREQLCRRAKHLVKAMKHFLAREKSKFGEDKRSKKAKDGIINEETAEQGSHSSTSDNLNKIVIQIGSNQKSERVDPMNGKAKTKLKKSHSMNDKAGDYRKPPAKPSRLINSHQRRSNYNLPSAADTNGGDLTVDNEANMIKITKMGTVSVPVPYPNYGHHSQSHWF